MGEGKEWFWTSVIKNWSTVDRIWGGGQVSMGRQRWRPPHRSHMRERRWQPRGGEELEAASWPSPPAPAP